LPVPGFIPYVGLLQSFIEQFHSGFPGGCSWRILMSFVCLCSFIRCLTECRGPASWLQEESRLPALIFPFSGSKRCIQYRLGHQQSMGKSLRGASSDGKKLMCKVGTANEAARMVDCAASPAHRGNPLGLLTKIYLAPCSGYIMLCWQSQSHSKV